MLAWVGMGGFGGGYGQGGGEKEVMVMVVQSWAFLILSPLLRARQSMHVGGENARKQACLALLQVLAHFWLVRQRS
jgi:hypothetical protein